MPLLKAYHLRSLWCGRRILSSSEESELLQQAKIVKLTPELNHLPVTIAHDIHPADPHWFPRGRVPHEWAGMGAAVRDEGSQVSASATIRSIVNVVSGKARVGRNQLLARLAPNHWA